MEHSCKPGQSADGNKLADEADYEVGYGKPPKSGQFKKGETGNPRGRPKKMKPRDPQDGDSYFEIVGRVLASPIRVNKNNRAETISSYEAVLSRLQSQALGGDSKSLLLLNGHRERMHRIMAGRPEKRQILFFNTDHGRLEFNTSVVSSGRSDRRSDVPSIRCGAENDRILKRELAKLDKRQQRDTFDPVEKLDNLLSQKFPVTINGRKQLVSIDEASLWQTVKGALEGKPSEIRSVLKLAEIHARSNTAAVITKRIILPIDDVSLLL